MADDVNCTIKKAVELFMAAISVRPHEGVDVALLCAARAIIYDAEQVMGESILVVIFTR